MDRTWSWVRIRAVAARLSDEKDSLAAGNGICKDDETDIL